jgi:hypothetical protein
MLSSCTFINDIKYVYNKKTCLVIIHMLQKFKLTKKTCTFVNDVKQNFMTNDSIKYWVVFLCYILNNTEMNLVND